MISKNLDFQYVLVICLALGLAETAVGRDRSVNPSKSPAGASNWTPPVDPVDPVIKFHSSSGINFCVERQSGDFECFGDLTEASGGGCCMSPFEPSTRMTLSPMMARLAANKNVQFLHTSGDGQMAITNSGDLIIAPGAIELLYNPVRLDRKVSPTDLIPGGLCLKGPRGPGCFRLVDLVEESVRSCGTQLPDGAECLITWDNIYHVARPLAITNFDQISMENHYYCTLSLGQVRCFKHGLRNGNVDDGWDAGSEVPFNKSWISEISPRQLARELASGVTSISSSQIGPSGHTWANFCAQKPERQPICWSFGFADSNNRDNQYQPVAQPGEEPWIVPATIPPMRKIISTPSHHCGITLNNRVTCWNNNLRLFDMDMRRVNSASVEAPQSVEELNSVTDILYFSRITNNGMSSEYGALCAISRGRMYCFGYYSTLEGALGGGPIPPFTVERGRVPKIFPGVN